jgi:hypothetical protein
LLTVILCLAAVLSGCSGEAAAGTQKSPAAQTSAGGGLIITEVMSKNTGSLHAPDGSTPDWIELYNSSNKTISLTGYMLSDNPRKPDKYVFEAGSLGAGDYLIVYATGKETVSAGTMYVPFKLSSAGEELTVISPAGKVTDRFAMPALPADVSYGRNGPGPGTGSAKVFYGEPTPDKPNGTDGKQTAEAAMTPQTTVLQINEFCTKNASLYDEAGDTPDWVELYNTSDKELNLAGYGLTDDLTKLDKWTFPEVSIAPKGYLLLLLAGKTDTVQDQTKPDSKGRLHVDFKLNGKETELVVSDNRSRIVATAPVEDLPVNVSKGRAPGKTDTWVYFPRPTPGTANNTASFATLSAAHSTASKDVMVSEVFAMGSPTAEDPQKDWVELYNATDKKISLNGYGLSDSPDDPFRMKLENVSIAAKSTVVVSPSGFGISARGETLLLTDPSGLVHDSFNTGHLRVGMSSGREVSASAATSLDRVFFTQPTKDEPNTSTGYKAYTGVPTITAKTGNGKAVDGLYVTGSATVTITAAEKDAKVYYTVDGRKPTASSTLYSGPFQLEHSSVIKAIAIRPGYLASDPISRTLLNEEPHSLPVVSLSGDPADLSGSGGVLMNAENSSEVPVEFAFYEKDGKLGIDSLAGAELHGQFSKMEAQKSLELKFRSAYGGSEITYPFFPGNKVNTFRRLVLRTSGQDWKITKVRDAYMTDIIAGKLNVDTMAVRYCAVYVNGKYWGLYDLREKLDQFYVASHYGVDPNKVDLIKGNSAQVAGTVKDMTDLINYCKSHDLTDPTAYKSVLARIDETSLMDFIIAESFFSNVDSGNKKFWRVNSGGGQWHWMVFDLDWAMFPSTYKADRLYGDLLDPAGHGSQNLFSTTLQVKLMQNPDFKEKFIERYAKFINNTFTTDRMVTILDGYVDLITDEMPRQIARWGLPSSMTVWQKSVDTLRTITKEKRAMVMEELENDFNLSDARMKELFPGDFK